MDILAGAAASIVIDFENPTGTLIPEAGSVIYSLFDHTGVGIETGQPITTTSTDTFVRIPIAALVNTISPLRRFEKRTLAVSWTTAGRSYTKVVTYRIVPLPPYSAVCNDVRTFLGLNEDELQDEEIDLFGAYLALDTRIPLDAHLASGTLDEQHANDAIVLTAVLKLIPSIRLRTIKESTSGSETFSRFASSPDFDRLEEQATSRLIELTASLLPSGTVLITPSLMVLSVPTDPITGA